MKMPWKKWLHYLLPEGKEMSNSHDGTHTPSTDNHDQIVNKTNEYADAKTEQIIRLEIEAQARWPSSQQRKIGA